MKGGGGCLGGVQPYHRPKGLSLTAAVFEERLAVSSAEREVYQVFEGCDMGWFVGCTLSGCN